MTASAASTLTKQERLCSRKLTDRLFSKTGSRSVAAYPLRVVWAEVPPTDTGVQAQMMVSVPKRCFKRAVHRNRVKRQVREAYRHAKFQLLDRLASMPDRMVIMAFIWTSDMLCSSAEVDARVRQLLQRLTEKL